MNERSVRDALRRAVPPDDGAAARDRAWRVARAAYAEHAPRRRRRRSLVLLAAGAPRWVQDVFRPGADGARPALVRVPGGGSLLVQSDGSTWVVSADGARRRLGAFSGASWSPRGLYVVAWRGQELTALEPGGAVRWSRSAPARIASARWAPGDGFRIAYLAGGDLRIVNGDGTDDRSYAAARAVAPAWRPDAASRYVLAYVDRRDRVTVADVDTGRRLWRTRRLPGVTRLTWAPDGDRLAAVARGRLVLFAIGSRTSRTVMGRRVVDVAWSSRAAKFAVVRTRAGRSEVVVRRGPEERVLFSIPGPLGAPVWSPDAVRLLIPWPGADQWLFLRPHGYGRPSIPVANIASQFAPGATGPPFPRTVQWCCTPP